MGSGRRILSTQKKVKCLQAKKLADDFYGIAFQAGKGYGLLYYAGSTRLCGKMVAISGMNPKPQRRKLKAVVNSKAAVDAFDQYLSYLQYMPPVAQTGQMDIFVIQDLYMQGKVGAIIDWVGLGEPVLDPKSSTVHDKSAFGPAPGTRKGDGSIDRTGNIGWVSHLFLQHGTAMRFVDEALNVVKWWLSPETQLEATKKWWTIRPV